ncbi:MAG: four helix bundle protein [bacterium]|nr:four helix bundle protein [bacterium]
MQDQRFKTKNSFEKLDVWKKAHLLTLFVYSITNRFPSEERFRLGDQIRRSSASITTNIVEGSSRHTKRSLGNFSTWREDL